MGAAEREPRLPEGARSPGRRVHPWAWWSWALCAAAAAASTTNPWLLLAVVAAVLVTVLHRRGDEPWARCLRVHLTMAASVLVLRVLFAFLFSATASGTLLWRLPQLRLPAWAAGVRIGGPVYLEPLLLSLLDAVRLATMLLCIGAATALADPRRALRSIPAALYELSVALIIALTVAPQLIESLARVRRAQRLRGAVVGLRALDRIVIPVLQDCLERAMALARSMESRGFGRTRNGGVPGPLTSALGLVAMVCLGLGVLLALGGGGPVGARIVLIVAGLGAAVADLRLAGRRLQVSHYRPDRWAAPEWTVLACGLVGLGAVVGAARCAPRLVTVSMPPLAVPAVHPLMALAAGALVAPALLTPAPPRTIPSGAVPSGTVPSGAVQPRALPPDTVPVSTVLPDTAPVSTVPPAAGGSGRARDTHHEEAPPGRRGHERLRPGGGEE